jgi:hypothetical protein
LSSQRIVFQLAWVSSLMRIHMLLEPPLLGTYQRVVEDSIQRAPADSPGIHQIVDFQRGADLVEEIEAARDASGRHYIEMLSQRSIDCRGGGEEARVSVELRVAACIESRATRKLR